MIRFDDSYLSIKVLINVEKHENPFLLKHPTDNISVGSSKLLIRIFPRKLYKIRYRV
nr:MAG TPA_asm: hypothetical protein [Caudoviricetes sp.]